MRNVAADPMPDLFKVMIKRLLKWDVLPMSCIPDSCIVNIYEQGDCIPPHIDSHDFVRPFCTVSFLSECNILFGTGLKVLGPGEFAGSFSIQLPVGYVLLFHFYCYVENTAPVEALIVVLSQLIVGYLASGGNTVAFLYKLVPPLCMLNDTIFSNRMLVIVLINPFIYFFR